MSVQTLLKLAEREAKLESRVLLNVEGRPLYRVRMLLPAGLKLDEVVAPGGFEQAVTDQDGRQLLTVYLAAGQTGEVPLVVRGTLEKPADAADLAAAEPAGARLPAAAGTDRRAGRSGLRRANLGVGGDWRTCSWTARMPGSHRSSVSSLAWRWAIAATSTRVSSRWPLGSRGSARSA